jgi:glycogen operon protein
MEQADWHRADAHAVALFLSGDAISEPGPRGGRIVDDSFLILLNSHHEPVEFTLPGRAYADAWQVAVDTATGAETADETEVKAGGTLVVPPRATLILISPRRQAGLVRRALTAAGLPRRPR